MLLQCTTEIADLRPKSLVIFPSFIEESINGSLYLTFMGYAPSVTECNTNPRHI